MVNLPLGKQHGIAVRWAKLAAGCTALLVILSVSWVQDRWHPGSSAMHPGPQLSASAGSAATRRLAQTDAWGREASIALDSFRSTLFPRMMRQYKEVEEEAYGSTEGQNKTIDRLEPREYRRFDLFDPIVGCPEGGALVRLGSRGDGGKFLCPLARHKETGCMVLSIGSNGQYDFEEAILGSTSCHVHTFDCTYSGKSLDPARHTYHRTCLADRTETRGSMDFKTLPDILSMLGNPVVDLLKMDIEGFEYEVVSGFNFRDSCSFPAQISMEVHYKNLYGATPFHGRRDAWANMVWPMHQLSLGELATFFGHLADLGYAVVSREDNMFPGSAGCCSEFTFIRVERPAHCAS